MNVTPDFLRTLFAYDERTGDLVRLTAPTYKNHVGQIAGSVCKHSGYRVVKIKSRRYPVHRIVWALVHGCWPQHEIDHINGIKTDNRIANLRDVPHQVNVQNLRSKTSSSSTGMLGVGPKGSKWRARITVNGVPRTLGTFTSQDDAQAAYVEAKRSLHVGCTI